MRFTRVRSTLALTFATVLVIPLLAPSQSLAAAQSLALPQGNAFAILGHSCGGIQERAYGTGFEAETGYPTGAVYLSTRCGGSGRGGGGGSTLYSAWATVTWDFTSAVVSDARASTAPTVNPTLVVYDAHGNELYNQAVAGVASGSQMYSQAYLVLASGFVPAPRLTGVSTSAGPASGGSSVTITGTGFTGAASVHFGNAAATSVRVTSSTSITAVAPVEAGGTVDITVTNAGGTSATSAADRFTFVAAPTVTGVSPSSGPLAGGNWVTVSGTHLATTSSVSIGDTRTGFNVINDTSLSVYIPAGESPEAVDIRITSIGGTSIRTSADRYTYLAPPPPPTVSAISPSSGTALGGTTVTITGTGFTNAVYVSFGGYAAQSFTVNSDTSITAVAPATYFDETIDVTVQGSSFAWSATSAADQFTYADAEPTVTAVSPNAGSAAGGETVTISGTGFATVGAVYFGGVEATSFTVDSDGSITATAPPASAEGTVDVTVSSFGGTSATSLLDQFTYL
jgi:IPT/TIG domain